MHYKCFNLFFRRNLKEDDSLKVIKEVGENAEFSHPLTEERINAIFAGDIDPEPFDYIAAEAHLMAHAAE